MINLSEISVEKIYMLNVIEIKEFRERLKLNEDDRVLYCDRNIIFL